MTADTIVKLAQSMIDSAPGETIADVLSYLLGLDDTETKILCHTAVNAGVSADEKDPADGQSLLYAAMFGLVFGMSAEACQMSPKVQA
jgi:hypothetical protein